MPKIDLLIGGSPCQDISHLKPRCNIFGEKSSLFFDYHKVYCKLLMRNPNMKFLLENVVGDNNSLNVITSYMGVFPHYIDSALLSYQHRKRLYWTNIYYDGHVHDRNITFQDYKETDYNICQEYKVNKTPSRLKMWGDGINGNCPNVTTRDKINCITCKQDKWSNAGLIQFEDFCRYLTVRECEQGQTLPIGYTECLTRNQAYDVIGDGWTVDVIAHILKGIKE